MPADVTELAGLQAWMLDTITHADDGRPDLAQLVGPSPRLGPSAALAIYRRAYARRVVSFMETMHPAVRHALGPERFDAVMLDYLHRHPPRGPNLSGLDENLAGYLEAAGSTPGFVVPPGMTLELVVDLVRLERLYHLVFDGPGTEDDHDHPPGGSPDRPDGARGLHVPWLDTSLQPAPCVRLLASRFPVHAYRTSVREGGHPEPPDPVATRLVVRRRRFVVTVTELDRDRYALLQALVAGVPLRMALALSEPTRAETAVRWVEGWVDDGVLRPVRSPPA